MSKSPRRNLRVAVQADPLSRLNVAADSTLAMMRAALRRGYSLFYYEPKDLYWRNDESPAALAARGCWVRAWPDGAPLPLTGLPESVDLAGCDVVLLRQDPPFDLAYITSTYLLEHVAQQTLVVNDPRAVRDAPEKLLITHYPDLLPPTLISADAAAIGDFRSRHGTIVLKPLYGHGGHGVVRVPAEANHAVVTQYLLEQHKVPVIAQKFLPEIAQGDKRIIVINGLIVTAYRRVPRADDFRANVAAGASTQACDITPRERAMVERFSRTLIERGIIFAGIDVIGDYIAEINVTSPTSFVVADALGGLTGPDRCEERFWDAIEQRMVLRAL